MTSVHIDRLKRHAELLSRLADAKMGTEAMAALLQAIGPHAYRQFRIKTEAKITRELAMLWVDSGGTE